MNRAASRPAGAKELGGAVHAGGLGQAAEGGWFVAGALSAGCRPARQCTSAVLTSGSWQTGSGVCPWARLTLIEFGIKSRFADMGSAQ